MAPWDLLAQPMVWKNWALWSAKAEAEAQRQKRASAQRKAGH